MITGVHAIVFAPEVRGGTATLTSFGNPTASTPDDPQPAGASALLVTSPVTIQGTGETITRPPPAAPLISFRLFQVTGSGSLTLRGLTLASGLAQGGGPAGIIYSGVG